MTISEVARSRFEAAFKPKKDQGRESSSAWTEYQAKREAILKTTLRLRTLRLAKETADADRAQNPNPPKPLRAPRTHPATAPYSAS